MASHEQEQESSAEAFSNAYGSKEAWLKSYSKLLIQCKKKSYSLAIKKADNKIK